MWNATTEGVYSKRQKALYKAWSSLQGIKVYAVRDFFNVYKKVVAWPVLIVPDIHVYWGFLGWIFFNINIKSRFLILTKKT